MDRTIPSERPKRGFISDTVYVAVLTGQLWNVPDIKAQEMTTNSKKMTWMPAMQIHGTSSKGISWKKLHALCRSCYKIYYKLKYKYLKHGTSCEWVYPMGTN